jgi:hypothetical protein
MWRGAAVDEQHKTRFRRRDLFAVLAAGGLTAAAGSMVSLHAKSRADTERYDEERKPRYRESEEVKTFYRVNRYPAPEKH